MTGLGANGLGLYGRVHHREIDLGVGDMVQEIAEVVLDHDRDDLEDLGIGVTGLTHRREVRSVHLAVGAGECGGEHQCPVGLGVAGEAFAVEGDFGRIQLCEVEPQIGVGGQAVIAAVDLGDRDGNTLARACIEAVAKGAAKAKAPAPSRAASKAPSKAAAKARKAGRDTAPGTPKAAAAPASKSVSTGRKAVAGKSRPGTKAPAYKPFSPTEPLDSNTLIHGIPPYLPAPGERYMSEQQLDHFRRILASWKQDLMQEVDRTMLHMKDEAANFPDPNDRATQESEFSLELRTRDRERKLIRKIDEALKRIEDGSYGYCLETGEPIGVKRLEARPVATLSVEAQERRERREKQFGDRDDWYR